MAYGLKYSSSFDSTVEQRYRMEIWEKDYADFVMPLIFAGVPVKHAWQTDEPKAPIKGSSLVLTLLNKEDMQGSGFHARTNFTYILGESNIYFDDADPEFTPRVGIPFTLSGHPDSFVNNTWTPIEVMPEGPGGWAIKVTPGLFTTDSSSADVIITTGFSEYHSITDFYSPNDDQFKGMFYWNEQLLFEGFLVQDDCNEQMADYIHEIVLSFNDNLGLLKDVALDANVPDFGGFLGSAEFNFVAPAPDNFISLYNTSFVPVVGVPFTLSGHIDPLANGTWTPIDVINISSGNWQVQVADLSFGADTVPHPVLISGSGNIDIYARNTLLNILRICLYNTSLELNTRIYSSLFEQDQDSARSSFEQTYIDTTTFLKNDNFDNCYDVLTELLSRFHLTLFQAYGLWNIARWDEVRYYPADKAVPYYEYDSEFTFLSNADSLAANFTTGFEQFTYPQDGLTRSIFRPYKYDKETFNYIQPKEVIKNYQLLRLGTQLSSNTVGSTQTNTYEFPADSYWLHFYSDAAVIVVVRDIVLDEERDRYVLQPKVDNGGSGYLGFPNVQFNDIEVNAGDQMDFSIQIKCATPPGDNVRYRFGFYIQTAVDEYYTLVNAFGPGSDQFNWALISGVTPIQGIGISKLILEADAESYLSYTLSQEGLQEQVPRFPADGLLRIRVYGTNDTNVSQPTVDAIWKDIKLTLKNYINESVKIIGHVHNSVQDENIKNNEDVEVFVDDAPRNTIAGVLFKPSFVNLLQERTSQWHRITEPTELRRIGDIMTQEQLFWRRTPRTKLEGTFYGLVQDKHISMLAVLNNVALPGLNFLFGSLENDYKNNNFNCTQWEICTDTEDDSDLISDYTFTYLYDSK